MALGIDIKVDSQQVKDAKRQIDMLNQSMNNTEGLGDLTIGAGASAEMKKLTQEMQRLKQIATQGDMKGGILNKQQFQEAQKMMTQINKGVQQYAKELQACREQYKALNQEQQKLAARKYGGTASADDLDRFKNNKIHMAELAQRQKELEVHRQKMSHIGYETSGAAGRIGGMSEAGGAEGPSAMAGLKKMMALGLAVAGGASILGFLASARGKYNQSLGHTTMLGAKGIRGGSGDGIGLGMGPLEYMGFMEQMSNQGIGAGNMRSSSRLAAAFAKGTGTDAGQVAGLYGSMYGATGNSQLAAGALAMAVAGGIKSIKMPEALTLIARNTNVTAMAMKGAGAGDKVGAATGLAIAAMQAQQQGKSYSQYAKSGEFMNLAQNGFKGAGTPQGELMLFNALGGFNGQMSFDKIFQMEKMKEAGPLGNPKLMKQMLGSLTGSKESRAAQLMKSFPEWNLSTTSAMNLLDMDKDGLLEKAGKSGKSITQMKAGSKEERALAAKMEKQFSGTAGAGDLQKEAYHESVLLKTGAKLADMFRNLELAGLKVIDKLLGTKTVDDFVKMVENLGKAVENIVEMTGGDKKAGGRAKAHIQKGLENFKSGLEGVPMTGPWMIKKARELLTPNQATKDWHDSMRGGGRGKVDFGKQGRVAPAVESGAFDGLFNTAPSGKGGQASSADYLKSIHDMIAFYAMQAQGRTVS